MVYAITINDETFATTSEVVKFDPMGSSSAVMEILGYGAASKQFLNLGNIAQQVKFTMTKYHADDSDAWDWFWTAAAQFNGVGDLLVTKTLIGGTTRAYQMTGAKIIVTVEEPMVLTTITHVEIEGPIATLET